jgi:hypothetical protein
VRSEELVPLTGGAYQARSSIANYLICENLFPEINPQESQSPVPVTHYPRYGLKPLGAPSVTGAGRGIFVTSQGQLYAVVGQNVYYITPNWNFMLLGQVGTASTPVSLSDNGTTAVIVDGSPNGWQITLATNAYSQISDGTGTFVGSNRVDFADTFLAFAAPGTNRWYLSDSNAVTFNALVQANKDSTPDPIQTLAFNLRQAWLIGTRNSEIWYNAGSTPFPYQEWPNVFVPYGCIAPYSLAQADVDLYWLSSNEQGKIIALKTKGYGVEAISTRALEWEWSLYSNVTDAIGGSFQQAGHTFIVFHFPTANRSWAYDLSTHQWHRRTYIDNNGAINRERVSFYASVGVAGGYASAIIGQDWQTGQIYALDPATYTDNGQPIVFKRSFPHQLSDLHYITYAAFVADFETGTTPVTTAAGGGGGGGSPWSSGFSSGFGPLASSGGGATITVNNPMLCMRYSNDGGNTWSNYRQKGLVSSGNYRSMMRWRGLGMARDRVFELMWAYPGPSALNGAYIEPIKHAA